MINPEFKHKAKSYIYNVKDCDEYSLVILVETYFRPFSFRLMEYILYGILRVICTQRADEMTIGLNQLKAINWISYLERKGKPTNFLEIICACENMNCAKETTKNYLRSK